MRPRAKCIQRDEPAGLELLGDHPYFENLAHPPLQSSRESRTVFKTADLLPYVAMIRPSTPKSLTFCPTRSASSLHSRKEEWHQNGNSPVCIP
jgi:hypothetical protein